MSVAHYCSEYKMPLFKRDADGHSPYQLVDINGYTITDNLKPALLCTTLFTQFTIIHTLEFNWRGQEIGVVYITAHLIASLTYSLLMLEDFIYII